MTFKEACDLAREMRGKAPKNFGVILTCEEPLLRMMEMGDSATILFRKIHTAPSIAKIPAKLLAHLA